MCQIMSHDDSFEQLLELCLFYFFIGLYEGSASEMFYGSKVCSARKSSVSWMSVYSPVQLLGL